MKRALGLVTVSLLLAVPVLAALVGNSLGDGIFASSAFAAYTGTNVSPRRNAAANGSIPAGFYCEGA
jgi:hypothetical protein